MAIPDYQSLMLPYLKVLEDGQEKTTRAIINELAEAHKLPEEERNKLLDSGKQRIFDNRVGWARTYLKKAQLIDSPKRGVLVIAERGKQVLEETPARIDVNFLNRFEEFREFRTQSNQSDATQSAAPASVIPNTDESLTPTEAIELAHKEFNNELASSLLSTVKQVSPEYFESIVVQLMLAMGYGGWSDTSGDTTQYSADGGIDGVINEDPLGLETIYLQAKRYTEGTIGRPTVQSFAGALDMKRAKKGVFITTSKFSREALEYVSLIEKKIVLIDGQRLADLMIKHNLGVTVKDTYQIKTLDTDFFSED